MKKTKATGVLALANATTVKSGTQATDACNATKSVHVFGARKTTSIKSALIFKAKTEKRQNVLTAMKHIQHGLNPACPT